MRSKAITTAASLIVCAAACLTHSPLYAAEYITGEREETRAYSPAVITQGGTIVWLAGVGGRDTETAGEPIPTDFGEQVHQVFRNLGATLERAGGTLQDIVTMTVFISDVRHGNEFVRIRAEYFEDGFPGSALITVAGFANTEYKVEVQAVAVIGETN
jgi:2-iminobutanoate/2-iminopropanoate deaminase